MDPIRKAIHADHLARRKQITSDFDDSLIKGRKSASEGEVREWNGVKYKKVGGKWVPVSKNNARREAPQAKSSKKDDQPQEQPQHEHTPDTIAKLKYIKKLTTRGRMSDAHELAQQLSDEAKSAIPQNLWDRMISSSFERDKKAKSAKSKEQKIKGE